MDIEHTAYHESGHAVMAYLCGNREFKRATIERTAEAFGEVEISNTNIPTLDDHVTQAEYIGQLLAGELAADCKRGEATTGLTQDKILVCEILYWNMTGIWPQSFRNVLMVPDPDTTVVETIQWVIKASEQALHNIEAVTGDALIDNWSTVEALAGELLEKKSLEGHEVLSLLDSMIGPDAPRPFG